MGGKNSNPEREGGCRRGRKAECIGKGGKIEGG